jgi:TRAP-type C4-dicarboxylate transport system substrate-binding protein
MSNFVPEVALVRPALYLALTRRRLLRAERFRILEDHVRRLSQEGVWWLIGYGENEIRDLTNIKREVRKPEDVKGLKIRVMEAPGLPGDLADALGASPVPMPFPEMYNALQQGVIDAQENPLMTSVLMKFTEVCPYATIFNYSLTACVKIVNSRCVETPVPRAAGDLFRGGPEGHQGQSRRQHETDRELMDKLAAEGKVKITYLTPEERAAFQKAVQPVYDTSSKRRWAPSPTNPNTAALPGKAICRWSRRKSSSTNNRVKELCIHLTGTVRTAPPRSWCVRNLQDRGSVFRGAVRADFMRKKLDPASIMIEEFSSAMPCWGSPW